MHESHALFYIGPLGVTGEITTMWVIMALLAVFSFIATRNLKERPGKLQNVAETIVEKLVNYYTSILGRKHALRYFPLLGTLFIFIIVCNFSGLFPGAGVVRGFMPPTSSLSVTAGFSLVVFIGLQMAAFRELGVKGFFARFFKPVFFMLPFLLIDEFVRPMSLALRLYGNIYGEETVTAQLYGILPVGAPLLMMVLSLLFCTIQAVVFTMLTSIYLEEVTAHDIEVR
ncbi:MAG: F0F1 ATP synthase subunit A [Christensenellales bacterium]